MHCYSLFVFGASGFTERCTGRELTVDKHLCISFSISPICGRALTAAGCVAATEDLNTRNTGIVNTRIRSIIYKDLNNVNIGNSCGESVFALDCILNTKWFMVEEMKVILPLFFLLKGFLGSLCYPNGDVLPVYTEKPLKANV